MVTERASSARGYALGLTDYQWKVIIIVLGVRGGVRGRRNPCRGGGRLRYYK
jgi:hypothetical protein